MRRKKESRLILANLFYSEILVQGWKGLFAASDCTQDWRGKEAQMGHYLATMSLVSDGSRDDWIGDTIWVNFCILFSSSIWVDTACKGGRSKVEDPLRVLKKMSSNTTIMYPQRIESIAASFARAFYCHHNPTSKSTRAFRKDIGRCEKGCCDKSNPLQSARKKA